ncbi:MAG: Pyrroline-5-carboxylate reductase, partial [Myxococcaceae bacterium]|nr:Pyrroline-5-carboxylate reductase [Myxococcaceae bacterium]
MKTKTLGFVGGGNMAEALVKGLLHAKVVPPDGILVSDVKTERLAHFTELHGVRTTQDNHELVRTSDVIVLSVKPQVIDKVLALIGGDVKSGQLVISVAAGVPVSAIEARLPEGTHVVRSMPNTPATVQ